MYVRVLTSACDTGRLVMSGARGSRREQECQSSLVLEGNLMRLLNLVTAFSIAVVVSSNKIYGLLRHDKSFLMMLAMPKSKQLDRYIALRGSYPIKLRRL